jgi:two-component sensor histidine kinase
MNDGETELGVLVNQALQLIAAERVIIEPCPAVSLSQYQVQPISMILHELATNAVKHGALSNTDGLVHMGWSTENEQGKNRLLLEWREEWGPKVCPPNHQGFGTQLIRYSSKADGGNAVFDYDPNGLRVQLTFLIGK